MYYSSRRLFLPLVVVVALALSAMVFAPTVPKAHAQTGPEIAILPSHQANNVTGGTVKFSVSVIDMPSFSGWVMFVSSTPSVLKPQSIVINPAATPGSAFETVRCINGVAVSGSCTTDDGVGVVHDEYGFSGIDTGTLWLFNITYSVVGPGTSPINFGGTIGPETVTCADASGVNCGQNAILDTSGSAVNGIPEVAGSYGAAALTADFSFTPTNPVAGQSVSFTSTVSGGTSPYTYGWTFGDTGTSTAANPTHTYTSAGSFSVGLTVTDAASTTASATHTVVVGKATPTITSAVSPASITVGSSATDLATVSGGASPTGTVTYTVFTTSVCTGSPVFTSSSIPLGAPSSAFTPAASGSYYWIASYSGDSNNNPVATACNAAGETLTVGQATPSLTTTILSTSGGPVSSITVGSTVTDQATLSGGYPATGVTGTVSYTFFSNGGCTGTGTPEGAVPVGAGNSVGPSNAVTPSPAGSYSFQASYSGDPNNVAVTSACEGLTVTKASPSMTTAVSPASITIGGSASDLATLSGSFSPSGSVTYNAYSDAACTVVVFTDSEPVGVASKLFAPATVGTFLWTASYPGDANNNVAASACGAAGETLTVGKASLQISSVVTPASITLGHSATDLASLTGGFSPTGSITYTAYSDVACSVVVFGPNVKAIGLSSDPFTPAATGTYYWIASYPGDVNNNGAATACGATSEILSVGALPVPTLTTTVLDSSGKPVTSVVVGSSVLDSASITPTAPSTSVTGSVTYNFYTNGACSGSPASSETVTITATGTVPNSSLTTPATAGSYSFQATYPGDSNNAGTVSPCEAFEVLKASTSISSVVTPASITIGASASDLATVSGGFSPTGTVTYTAYSDSVCTVIAFSDTESVGVASKTFTPTAAGTYLWVASYSGDSNNLAATGSCGAANESLTVGRTNVSIATSIQPSAAIPLGGSVTDQATLTGGYPATGVSGTVTYNFFGGSGCGAPSLISSQTVTVGASNSVPPTSPITPTSAGVYSFNAMYSGDGNNNPATSSCELLTVQAPTTTTTTVTFPTGAPVTGPVPLGSNVTDTAAVTASPQPFPLTGTVTYNFYSNTNCALPPASSSTVPIGSPSPQVGPLKAGGYSFQASYSGDGNYLPSTSQCEPFAVPKATTAVATQVIDDSTGLAPSGTETTGASFHDTATITSGATFNPTGTVTYTFYSSSGCSGAGIVQTVSVSSTGAVPNSASTGPSAAGSYSYLAVYSGDTNYLGSASPCEPFTVGRSSTATATVVLSAATGILYINPQVTPAMTVGSSFTVQVKVANMPSFNGWDIMIVSNQSVINSVSLTDSLNILTANSTGTTFSIINCVNGSGTGCTASDGPGIVHSEYGGTMSVSGNGLLFTITYTVTGSGSSPITIQKGQISHNGTNVPHITQSGSYNGSSLAFGSTYADQATVTASPQPFPLTGTVTYNFYSNGSCAAPVASSETVPVGAPSSVRGPLPAGDHSFQASYSGDGNYLGSISACEPFTVPKYTPSITSTVTPASITVGGSASDLATVSGGFSPSGTVTYTAYSDAACTVVAFTDTEPLGVASVAYFPTATGTYLWVATYNGDANNVAASTSCGAPSESLTVAKASPQISSLVSPLTITIGGSATDLATLSGGFSPTGTVTYTVYSDAGCTTVVFTDTEPVGIPSKPFTPTAVGTYYWIASYSGDSNNNAASTVCGATNEILIVTPATISLTTTILPSSTVGLGQPVTDQATITGGYPSTGVSGTVTYKFNVGGQCTPTAAIFSQTVPVGPGNSVPPTSPVTPPSAGTFSFLAMYSGDANNLPATSSCELLTVTKATPTITSTVTPSTVPVASPANDLASIVGISGFTPTGSVTYIIYSDSACTVQVFTDTEPLGTPSAPFTPTAAGTYQWIAKYLGDSNYNSVSTACGAEPLQVTDFTVSASPTNVNPPVGVLTGSSTIMVTGINGFTGTVSLTVTTSTGLSCSITPPSLSLTTSTSSASSTLSCSATATGTYTAIVTGTSPGFPSEASHTAHVTFTFSAQAFSISASPNYFIGYNQNGRNWFLSIITVKSLGGFSGTVTLSASSSPSTHVSFFLFPTSVTVTAGGSAIAFLLIAVGPHASPGTYTITVTGQSGSTTKTATITIIMPNKTVQINSLTWTHTLSVSSSGGVQKWTASITNTGSTAQYVQLRITGQAFDGTHPFTAESSTVLVAAGATVSLTASTASGAFTSSDVGKTFFFQASAFFGPTSGSLTNTSPALFGSFNAVA